MTITIFGVYLHFGQNLNRDYSYVGATLGLIACIISSLRWLRVAQREHYIPGYTSRFSARWYSDWQRPLNPILGAISVLVAIISVAKPHQLMPSGVGLLVVILCLLISPVGLSYKGSTSPLKFTKRLSKLAFLTWLIEIIFLAIGVISNLGVVFGTVALVFVPPTIDLGLLLTIPLERKSLGKFVEKAQRKLEKISPRVVAITGSFGKTSTKTYLAHLVSSTYTTLASPASFNNRAGLARTINENLSPGTEVFIAEMGTFKKGEIEDLCSWIPPNVSAITSIGPVHLERFGSEDAILEAKSEITDRADTVALNMDDFRLSAFSLKMESLSKKVWKVSGQDIHADVAVKDDDEGNLIVYVQQKRIGSMPDIDISRTNLGIAVALAIELGVPESVIAERLPSLPVARNRLNVAASDSGVIVLDDTYNSNPAGARLALRALERRKIPNTRSVVVTPGMIELGKKQFEENSFFGRAAARVATDFVIVGYTNRRALLDGVTQAQKEGAKINLVLVKNRPEAVEWVRSNLVSGDAVLYENDLPDHFL